MKKIPTIFLRNFNVDPSRVTADHNPECDWVFKGVGIAARKYDGTCCMYDGDMWWKRREVKKGKNEPFGFRLLQADVETGKKVGWVPVYHDDKWHLEGIKQTPLAKPGTYELCGPKVQGNPEGLVVHAMLSHADAEVFKDVPRDWMGMSEFFRDFPHEGLIFCHPKGLLAKIKRKDFGYVRPSELASALEVEAVLDPKST